MALPKHDGWFYFEMDLTPDEVDILRNYIEMWTESKEMGNGKLILNSNDAWDIGFIIHNVLKKVDKLLQ